MFSSLAGDDVEDIQDKRVRVLRLHVEELTRQAGMRDRELRATRAKLKELEVERTAAKPNERKLFARLEQLQAELKLAKEHKHSADTRASDLAAQLEQVVSAAQAETEAPGQKLLLRVTTEQLEATQTALQQAVEAASAAEQQAQYAEAQEAAVHDQLKQAERRELALGRRMDALLSKCAESSMLQLPPPSKGSDLEEQHHILTLNFRHVQSELQRKTLAAEGLVEQRDVLLEELHRRASVQQDQQRKLRAELKQQKQDANATMDAMRQQLLSHTNELEALRTGSASISGEGEKVYQAASSLAVRASVAAAVRKGALRGSERRAARMLSRSGRSVMTLAYASRPLN